MESQPGLDGAVVDPQSRVCHSVRTWFDSCDRPESRSRLALEFRTVHVPPRKTNGESRAAVAESSGGLAARRKALKLDGAPWPWLTPHATVSTHSAMLLDVKRARALRHIHPLVESGARCAAVRAVRTGVVVA